MPNNFWFHLSLLLALACTASAQESAMDSLLDKRVYQKNIKIYRNILKSGPNHDVTLKLADALRLLKKYKDAEAEYSKVIDHPDLSPIHYKHYGEVLCQLGRAQECEMWKLRYKELVKRTDKISDALLQVDTSKYFINRVPFNSPGTDFGPAFYKDGLMYVSSYSTDSKTTVHQGTGESFYKFYYAQKRSNGEFGTPLQIFKDINTTSYEGPVTFSSDFREIYFNRNNLNDLKAKSKDKSILLQFVKGKVANDAISDITDFAYNNAKFSCTQPSLSWDGNNLYFASNVDSALGGTDLYVCTKENGNWSTPKSLGNVVNTPDDEMYPYITKDGKLFFSSNNDASMGGLDVFMTEKVNGEWTKPVHLPAPFNTIFDDFSYIIHEESGEGYLSSNRAESMGMDDIFQFNPVYKDSVEEALYRPKLISIINKDNFAAPRGNKLKGKLQTLAPNETVTGSMVQLLDQRKKVVKQCFLTPDGFFSFSNVKADNYLMVVDKAAQTLKPTLAMSTKQTAKVDVQDMVKYKIGYVRKDSLHGSHNRLVVGKLLALGKSSGDQMVSLLLVDSTGKIVRRVEVADNSYFIFRDLPSDNYNVFTEDNNPNYTTDIFYQNPDQTNPIFRSDLLQFHYKHLTMDSLRENNLIIHGQVLTDNPDGNIVLLVDGSDNVIDKTVTNAQGYFAFRDLDGEDMHVIVVNDHPLLALSHETVYQREDSIYLVTKKEIYRLLPYDDSLLVGKTVIQGKISLDGKPLEDRLMLLMDSSGKIVRTTKTNKEGLFAFRHLTPDDYYIIANEKEPGYLLERTILYEDPLLEVSKNDFKKSKAKGSFGIEGKAKDKRNNAPLREKTVVLMDENGKTVRQATTGDEGAFRFVNLAPDHYFVSFGSYEPNATAEMKVIADDPLHLPLVATPIKHAQETSAPSLGLSVFFDYNGTSLLPAYRQAIEQFAKQLEGKHPIIVLHGFTDMKGSDTFNLRLAEQRIQACVRMLVRQDASWAIEHKAVGKTNQFLDKRGAYSPALNRRVEIRVKN